MLHAAFTNLIAAMADVTPKTNANIRSVGEIDSFHKQI